MTILDWILGVERPSHKVSKDELSDVRVELNKAIGEQKNAQKRTVETIENSQRVSRALHATAQALNLASSNRDRSQ